MRVLRLSDMALSDIAFVNARLIDAKRDFAGSIEVRGGKIQKVARGAMPADGLKIVDLNGLALMPGFIDLHAHLRIPGQSHKEDFGHGLAAALIGGFTTVCGMANTAPAVDTAQAVAKNNKDANSLNLAGYIQISAIGQSLADRVLVDTKEIGKHTPLFSNDGINIDSSAFLKEALARSREEGFLILFHCEPESESIAKHLQELSECGGRMHFCHISRAQSLEIIQKAKNEGLNVTCETAPHYLYASENSYAVNPPIGTHADRLAVIGAARSGLIDAIATDHAPHTEEDKANGMNGISSFDYAFSLANTVFEENSISKSRLSEMLSACPAKLIGLNKGLLEPGMDADFSIVDFSAEYQINTNDFYSKSKNTPFAGEHVKGRTEMSIIGGNIRHERNRQAL
ncbi:MAG: amidohydrolase family protein [Eubacteriaceae bacterium]|nr:amidohydrolase family protein [Eubacteriaceae bacterium]